MQPTSDVEQAHSDIVYPAALPFALVHLSCLAAFWTGVSVRALVICVALYWVRIFLPSETILIRRKRYRSAD